MNKIILFVGNHQNVILSTRHELLEELKKEGYDIIVSIPDNLPEELRDERIALVRNSIFRFGTNPLSELKTVLALRKQIRQVNPNVVVTFTIKPNLYSLIACGRRYPIIANVTGLSAFLFKPGVVPSVISKIQNMMFKRKFCILYRAILLAAKSAGIKELL